MHKKQVQEILAQSKGFHKYYKHDFFNLAVFCIYPFKSCIYMLLSQRMILQYLIFFQNLKKALKNVSRAALNTLYDCFSLFTSILFVCIKDIHVHRR